MYDRACLGRIASLRSAIKSLSLSSVSLKKEGTFLSPPPPF